MSLEVFALVLLAAVMHAGWNFATRRVAGHMGVVWLGMWASSIALLPGVIAVAWWCDLYAMLTWTGLVCMVVTGLTHAIYFILLSGAYEQGDISVVYPIARGSGIGLTSLGAWLLLGEQVSLTGGIGIAGIFCGIMVLGVPAFARAGGMRSIKFALGVGATMVVYSLVDKIGVGIVHPVFYIWFMYFSGVLMLWPFVTRRYAGQLREIGRQHRPYVLTIGLGSCATYLLILLAYRLGPISYIIALREFAVVVGAGLGFVFLKERLTAAKAVAIISIVAGLICIKMG
jgi:uncharacterized membrane protein